MIGFSVDSYNATEGNGEFNDVTVELKNGSVAQEVMVSVSAQSGSAQGKNKTVINNIKGPAV